MPRTPSDCEGVQKGILDTSPHFEGITKKTNLELFVFDILTISGTREVEASCVLADINFDPRTSKRSKPLGQLSGLGASLANRVNLECFDSEVVCLLSWKTPT